MDPTLSAILHTLFEYSRTIDVLRARVAELENTGQAQLAEIRAHIAACEVDHVSPGVQPVKEV